MSYYDILLAKQLSGGGGGGSTTIEPLTVTENGTYSEDGVAYRPVTVDVPSSGGEVPENDVIFIDYDGTILYSYTAQQFSQLSEMPANPTHEGLTAQGWNWTLADAKIYVAKYGQLTIGQMYDTTDGTTKIYIHVTTDYAFFLNIAKIYGKPDVTIDWGDETTTTVTSTTSAEYSHQYAQAGDYVVTISNNFTALSFSSANGIFGGSSQTDKVKTEKGRIRKIYYGSNASETAIGGSGYLSLLSEVTMPDKNYDMRSWFKQCSSLKALVIPKSTIITTYNQLCSQCSSMKYISFPNYTTTINSTFSATDMYSLRRIEVPEGVKSISGTFCSNAPIKRIAFPDTLTEITVQTTLNGCFGLKSVQISSLTPPTFTALKIMQYYIDYIFYVPASALNDYKTAWADIADRIYAIPA